MKRWSEDTMEALRRWLAPSTWHTPHPSDMGRFYVFVASVWNDIHAIRDEAEARELMKKTAEELNPGEERLISEVIEKRRAEGTKILDFLSLVRDERKFALITRS